MFYDNMNKLCEENGISVSALLGQLGIDRSAASRWKNGAVPYNSVKKKIADYFGITVSQLMSGETEKAPTEEVEADEEMIELLEEIKSNPRLKTLFSLGKSATPKELKKYIDVIRAMRGDDMDE